MGPSRAKRGGGGVGGGWGYIRREVRESERQVCISVQIEFQTVAWRSTGPPQDVRSGKENGWSRWWTGRGGREGALAR